MTVAREIERLVARDHHDPHSVLGAHPTRGGVVVRAFRPGADRIVVVPDSLEPVRLRRLHRDGVFAGRVAGASLPLRYVLEISYPGGTRSRFATRTRFPPRSASSTSTSPPKAGTRSCTSGWERIPRRTRRHRRRRVRSLGAERPLRRPSWATSTAGTGASIRMRSLGGSGIWELFLPGVEPGARYKFEIRAGRLDRPQGRPVRLRRRGATQDCVCRVFRSKHAWRDAAWLERRAASDPWQEPFSVYEVHLGSWRLNPLEGNRSLTYAELGDELAEYVTGLGFTHVELMPVMEHPFSGSWGYQATGFYAPTARFGGPDDFRALVDRLHGARPRSDPRLGARPLPEGRLGARPLRRHPALRARGSAARRASRLGNARLQPRSSRGTQLPRRQCSLLAAGVPRRRPARGCGRLDALPRLLAGAGGVDAERLRRARGSRCGGVPAPAERGRSCAACPAC